MVQSLAKWLRLLGYDCVSSDEIFGRKLVERAVQEDRWVLSRNTTFSRYLPKALLEEVRLFPITSETLPEQLREVVRHFNLDPEAFLFTRCTQCNTPLHKVDFHAVESQLPPDVAVHQTQFWRCDNCGRVYWQGSHVTRSAAKLRRWLANVS